MTVIQVRYITISVFWHHLLITTPMRARTAGLREKYRGREGATFGVWRFTFGVLRFTFGVSRLAFRVSFRVSRLTFGVWRFVSRFATFGVWRFVSPFAFRILWALQYTKRVTGYRYAIFNNYSRSLVWIAHARVKRDVKMRMAQIYFVYGDIHNGKVFKDYFILVRMPLHVDNKNWKYDLRTEEWKTRGSTKHTSSTAKRQ